MNRHFTSLLLASGLLLASLPAASAAVIYVNHAATGANNGSSWTDAFLSLQSAIATSVSGDQIWVAQGTYVPSAPHFVGGARSVTFYIPGKNVQLYGGFDGTETLLSQRDWVANPTVLSGEIGAPGLADNAFHVLWLDNCDNSMRVDGFTIRDGNADLFFFPQEAGGGIFLDRFTGSQTSPTIANCTFTGNHANRGGAIFCFGFFGENNPQVTGCTFDRNVANFGGAVYNYSQGGSGDASPDFSDCTFSGNYAAANGGAVANHSNGVEGACQTNPSFTDCTFFQDTAIFFGGAIFTETLDGGSSSPSHDGCVFNENRAGENGGATYAFANDGYVGAAYLDCDFTFNHATSGGAVFHRAGAGGACEPTLDACLFENNTAAGGSGGAAYNHGDGGVCTPVFQTCTFVGNSAGNVGGALVNDNASQPLTHRCDFLGNSATNNAGGYFGSGADHELVNCVFSGNEASNPSAVYFLSATNALALNCSFSGNDGVTCLLASGSSASLKNGIVWGNGGGVTGFSVDFSIVEGGHSGTDNLNADPLFVDQPPVGLGAGGDLRLLSCSPAIETGTNAGAPADDFDGNPRPHDADGNAGAETDMGAFEFQGTASGTGLTAVCQDQTLTLTGASVSLPASSLDGGSSGCTPLSFEMDGQATLSFDCAGDAGEHLVTLTVTDATGASATCQATVTVGEDADCDGFGDPCDLCPGGDDSVDNNGDNLPDCKFYPGFANLITDWKCGNNGNKVVFCHDGKTKCFGQGSVADHLAHGDFLGPCDGASCTELLVVFGDGDLLDLQAFQQEEHVELFWLNNTGWKNDRFILEKSTDGERFEPVGEQGNGSDDSQVKLYRADDERPAGGANFYRIRLLLQNGETVFSNLAQAHFPLDPSEIQIFPNPASEAAWLYLEKFAGKPVVVQVFDPMGRQVFEREFAEAPGAVRLSLQDLKEGLHSVAVQAEGFRWQVKRLAVVR